MGRYAAERNKGLVLSDGFYDFLNYLVKYILPGAITLYGLLALQWEWPDSEKVIISATGVITFLGVIIGVSKIGYRGDGDMVLAKNLDGEELNPILYGVGEPDTYLNSKGKRARKFAQFEIIKEEKPLNISSQN